ncbi:hypothetical protein W97_05640 [Coniosporium apollinis CBS 100218]|uniref:Uncharacterized protein n=1 Tax=Coniosporium apollinis (strain CBS 100218) TaxID=1168221 RepID=R7YWG3_CONA1|nr:uncharacterized protein W97_05640 [Coniosporium apollinis CBS 100218]EON66247.1 hypothetical protein W97_05640 [Coniosporium apollinis CBS 100218]
MWNPLGSPPVNDTTPWHPEPTFRGTFSILSGCIITLILCVWTAVHLNVPEHKKEHMQKYRKFKWLAIGLFAPELIAWTAFDQYTSARKFDKDMRTLLGEPPEPTLSQRLSRFLRRIVRAKEPYSADIELPAISATTAGTKRNHPWTFVHSPYVVMGGMVFDISHVERKFLPDERTRLTLTTKELLNLAEYYPSLVPDISQAEIEDKSKGDGLAKTLVCVQVLWFCIQCITRLAQGLSVSLLELNTFGHALCAMLIYLLWWYKPLDVSEPTLITDESAHPVCAVMCTLSEVGSFFEYMDYGGTSQRWSERTDKRNFLS